MEQCFKVNVLKSGFSITNYHITVPTTQVCDHRTQLWLCNFRLHEHLNQGENLKVIVVQLGELDFFFMELYKVSMVHRHIDSVS